MLLAFYNNAATGTSVSVTGEVLTAAVGTVSVAIAADVTVTGEVLTASVGTVSFAISADVPVTGEALTISVGDVSVAIAADVPVTGEVLTISLGTAAAAVPQDVLADSYGFALYLLVGVVDVPVVPYVPASAGKVWEEFALPSEGYWPPMRVPSGSPWATIDAAPDAADWRPLSKG